MGINYGETVYRINCLTAELDSLYHQAALKLKLSDSVMIVLSLVFENGGSCPLSEIRAAAYISKQTLHSAVRKLENEGLVRLEQSRGRAKNVCLTERGKEYAERTIARLFQAECGAFHGWTKEEIEQYLALMERYNSDFRREIEKM